MVKRNGDERPIGIINGVYLYQRDLNWCKELVAKYDKAVKYYQQKFAETGKSIYRIHIRKAKKDARRMRQNLAAQEEAVGNWDPKRVWGRDKPTTK